MPKRRQIDPAIFRDKLFRGKPLLRDAYFALWCACDDQGVFYADTNRLEEEVFDGHPCGYDLAEQTQGLLSIQRVVLFTAHGFEWWWLPRFIKHQNPSKIYRLYPTPSVDLVAQHLNQMDTEIYFRVIRTRLKVPNLRETSKGPWLGAPVPEYRAEGKPTSIVHPLTQPDAKASAKPEGARLPPEVVTAATALCIDLAPRDWQLMTKWVHTEKVPVSWILAAIAEASEEKDRKKHTLPYAKGIIDRYAREGGPTVRSREVERTYGTPIYDDGELLPIPRPKA